MHIALLLLLFSSISSVISLDNPPELKFAFNYQFLDYLKTSFLKPIIENKVKNLTLTNTFSIKKDLLQLNISNISFTDFQIDWTTSGLTVLENRQHPSLVLRNLSLNFTFDSKSNFLVIDLQGKNNKASVQNLDIEIDLTAGYSPQAVSCVHIANAAVSIQKIDIQMSKSVPHILLLLAKAFGAKFEVIVANAIQEKILGLNQTLIDKTSSHHTFTVHDLFAVNISLAELPFIFNVQHQAYQALSFNIDTKNIKTGQLAPVAPIDMMPDYIDGELPVQIIMSESLLEQFLWGFFQTEFKYELSQENVPKDFPAPLTTTGLKILFPNFELIYGADKGIYISIEKGGDDPRIYIRDGRLSGTASINMTLVVDTENKEYPQQGLDKCVEEGHCETAVEMNVTVFFGAVVYKKSSTMIGVKVMNVQLASVEVKRGNTDGKALETLINKLTVPLLGQINVQLAAGITNPLIGLFGLNNASVAVGADYLLLGASFDGMEQLEV